MSINMDMYPENYWEGKDIEAMKMAYFSSALSEVKCLAPSCDGMVKIVKEEASKNPYKKRGDFTLSYKCNKCNRIGVSHLRGHYKQGS